ncbi:MAG: hypothetical protein QNJ97_04790 [Myxococcota bacterium]|nr:hypothetical protein [Myxococcota bacterium]
MNRIGILLLIISLSMFTGKAVAEVPWVLPVSGVLTDLDDNPLIGLHRLAFTIYDAEVGGDPLWSDVYVLNLKDGIFSVYLGEKTALDLLDFVEHDALWLGVQVENETSDSRIEIASAPFAVEAQYCRQVVGVDCKNGKFLQGWDHKTGEPICMSVQFAYIDNLPEGLGDGDNDTIYSAGAGLALSADNAFSVNQDDIENWAMDVCYDSKAELLLALDDEYVNENQLGGVTSDMLVAGIAPEKIQGTAWTSENDGPETGLSADLLDGYQALDFSLIDHRHDSDYQGKYKFTVIVSPVGDGSDTVANGQALYDALESIRGAASQDSPYLLKIEPGVYHLQEINGGHRTLKMQDWIDIEGSGENMTKITSVGTDQSMGEDYGVIEGANHAELRFLTAESTGAYYFNIAIVNKYTSPKITNVTAIGREGQFCVGISNRYFSAPHIESVTAKAECWNAYGIRNFRSQPTLINVNSSGIATGAVGGGIRNSESNITILRSVFKGESSNCITYGIRNRSSSLVLIDVTASAVNGRDVRGIINFSANLTATNLTVTAANGSATTHGIINEIHGDELGPHSVKVFNSKITSSGQTISNTDGYSVWIASSLLDGDPPVGAGNLKCTYVVDGNYDAYTCPQ